MNRKGTNGYRVPPTEAVQIVVLYSQGVSKTAIAHKLGISRNAVYRVLRHDSDEPRNAKQVCGTNAAYHRHLYNKEKPCLPCTDAHAEDHRLAHKRRQDAKRNGEQAGGYESIA